MGLYVLAFLLWILATAIILGLWSSGRRWFWVLPLAWAFAFVAVGEIEFRTASSGEANKPIAPVLTLGGVNEASGEVILRKAFVS